MQSLYAQAQDNVQSVFNFYLTLVTTVVGAIIVLLQITPAAPLDNLRTRLLLIGMLLFTALVGTVYLSALSGRYAHAARYARAIDELRYYLMHRLNVPLPSLYNRFLQEHQTTIAEDAVPWWLWIFPSGTYQMFIAILNSLALSIMTGLLAGLGTGNVGQGSLAALLVFAIAFNIYNVYARVVIRTFQRRLHVRIDAGGRLASWASRE